MICKRCLNEDQNYFYNGSKGLYCRKCIKFKRILIEEEREINKLDEVSDNAYDYLLKYPLTKLQKEVSALCMKYISSGDVLINAVCGAGKTEIVIETISCFLKNRKKVCIAISRRQVVLELVNRLKEIFVFCKVVAICQGYTKDLDGDLIVCTTHQCYRFYQAFDLLILDEPDAFPYKNNDVLRNIVKTSCKGNMIYLTATLDEYLKNRIRKNDIALLKLNKRPHGKDLIVPKVIYGFNIYLFIYMIYWLKKHNEESNLIFVPTIKMAKLFKILLNIECCHSKTVNKDEIIEKFRSGKIKSLLTTTILERGITIENINVCVFKANHSVFDEASLIQMSGRVGRSFKYPYGNCLFLADSKSISIKKCVNSIMRANNG